MAEVPPTLHSAPVAPAAPAPTESVDPVRQAKAEATRAALATIAAAAHAAHLHDDEVHRAEEQARAAGQQAHTDESAPEATPGDAGVPAARDAASHDAAVREARSTPVLRFGGEEVALPFVEHHEEPPAGKPAMSLDLLAEAFSHLGAAPAAEEEASSVSEPATASPVSPASSPAVTEDERDHSSRSRGRRGRRNRSASRAQGAANETSVEHHDVTAAAAGGSAHEAKAPAAEEPAKKKVADEPIILGVGVPASEL